MQDATDLNLGYGREGFRGCEGELLRLTGASREVRSLVFDPRILRARQPRIATRVQRGRGPHWIFNKRVVHDAKDGAFLIDQTKGDAAKWKAVHKVRSAVCDAYIHIHGER